MWSALMSRHKRKHNHLSDRERLKQFVRAVYDMMGSRFIARVKVQDHSVTSEVLESGERRITAPEYDLEDFISFLTTFRIIAMSRDEPVYLPGISNIVSRHASQRVRQELKEMRAQIIPRIEGRYSCMRLGRGGPQGDASYTSYELLNALVNGLVFYRDPDYANVTELIRGARPWHYVSLLLREILLPVAVTCNWLVNVIRRERLLDDAGFPSLTDAD